MAQDVGQPRSPARATDRGLRLVVAVAEHPDGLALAHAARTVGLSPSTALRQLRSLEVAGFATRDGDGHWLPGPELLRIARSLSTTTTLPRLAGPTLSSLSAGTGESAYLAEAADRRTAIYVAVRPGRHAVRHVSWLGQRVPRRGTAVGAALAGRVDDDGVAERHDVVEADVTAVSAPVRGPGGQIVAALSVVGPTSRLSGALVAQTRRLVADHALALSHLAGGDSRP